MRREKERLLSGLGAREQHRQDHVRSMHPSGMPDVGLAHSEEYLVQRAKESASQEVSAERGEVLARRRARKSERRVETAAQRRRRRRGRV